MFRGTDKLNLDAKGRLQVPAKHRERLREISGSQLIVVTAPKGDCLWLYPLDEWEEVEERIRKTASPALQELVLRSVSDVDMDAQGRILLPAGSRETVGLAKKVAMVGMKMKLAIWDESRLDASTEELRESAREKGSELNVELDSLVF